MSTTVKALLIGGVSLIILVVTLFVSASSWYDGTVNLDRGARAVAENRKNILDNNWKKVREVAQVPAQFKKDWQDLLTSETSAKYGPEGSKAMVQFFTDRNITLPTEMYVKLQNILEAGREEFKRSQTEMLDRQRALDVRVHSFWGRIWAGYFEMPQTMTGELAPPKDTDGDGRLTILDFRIVTSTRTDNIFETGHEDEPINVFGNTPAPATSK